MWNKDKSSLRKLKALSMTRNPNEINNDIIFVISGQKITGEKVTFLLWTGYFLGMKYNT